MSRHAKFKSYWESIGKPPLEYSQTANILPWLKCLTEPSFEYLFDYRIAGDIHWELRRKWVDSDFKLKVEFFSKI